MEKLKIIIVTQDEPFYVSLYLSQVIRRINKDIKILKIYALPPNLPGKNFTQTLHQLLNYFGPIVFTYLVILRCFYFTKDCISTTALNKYNNLHSVKLISKKFDIKFSKIKKINSKKILNEINELKPDLIFSLACPQILRERILQIPKKGCLNIHSSLLPKYKGVNANFWVMAKGEKVTGVTAHYMNQKIDDGNILLQRKIDIDDKWTLHNLYLKVIDVGSKMTNECFKMICEGTEKPFSIENSEESYFNFPSKKDVKEFRLRKKKFFKYH